MKTPQRYPITLLMIFCYLIPVVVLSAYSLHLMPQNDSWRIFSLGLGMAACGSMILFLRLQRWESQCVESVEVAPQVIVKEVVTNVPSPEKEAELQELQKKNLELLDTLVKNETALNELQQENKDYQQRVISLVQESEGSTHMLQVNLQLKECAVQENEQTISELKAMLEKHQEHIKLLEDKENELQYEIKTLLELTNIDDAIPAIISEMESLSEPVVMQPEPMPEPPLEHPLKELQVSTPEGASQQLKRCLDVVTKITGAHQFHLSSPYLRDLQVDHSVLDLRHLFDSLRVENSSIVLFYSQKENRLLFANNQVKNMLGWNSEKFVHQFSEIIQESSEEWIKGMSQLANSSEVRMRLAFKARSGDSMPLNCHLGMVSSGLYRHSVVAILY